MFDLIEFAVCVVNWINQFSAKIRVTLITKIHENRILDFKKFIYENTNCE